MVTQLCEFTKIVELYTNVSAFYGMYILPQ